MKMSTMNLFKRHTDKKEAERKEALREQREEIQAAREEVKALEIKMTSRPCAIRGFDLCSYACVHWLRGDIRYFPPWNGEYGGFFYAIGPKCRLWGGK